MINTMIIIFKENNNKVKTKLKAKYNPSTIKRPSNDNVALRKVAYARVV